MIKNRTAQLIFKTSFGILEKTARVGTFNYELRTDAYINFTNLSNDL